MSENGDCTWRSKCRAVAVIEIDWGLIGTPLMITTLCVYFEAKAKSPPPNGSYQDFQGMEAFAIDVAQRVIISFLVMTPLTLLFGVLLLVATKESLVDSKPKLCYRMVCVYIIFALANIIFNFVAGFLVAGKTILFPMGVCFVQSFLCISLPWYAGTLYKKIHRPHQTMIITPLGDFHEDREPTSRDNTVFGYSMLGQTGTI